MAGHQDVKDIEADLKRMLNMMSGDPGGGNEKEKTSMTGPQPHRSNEGGNKSQKAEKKKAVPKNNGPGEKMKVVITKSIGPGEKESNNSALDNRQEEKILKKKKKRKKQKKKVKDKPVSVNDDGLDSDSGSEEEGQKPGIKKNPQPTYTYLPKYLSEFKGKRNFVKWMPWKEYLDDKLTPAIVKELEAQRIYPLKKRSAPFPNALYFCRLCDYHCDNVPVCRQHANDARHRRRLEIMQQDKKLKNLPTPSADHYAALTTVLEKICLEQGLSDEDIKHREMIAQSLQDFLQQTIPALIPEQLTIRLTTILEKICIEQGLSDEDIKHREMIAQSLQDFLQQTIPALISEQLTIRLITAIEKICVEQGLSDKDIKHRETIAQSLQDFLQQTIPDLRLRIYGSTLTGFGLKQSDLNLDLVLPAGSNSAKGLSLVYKTLLNSDVCSNVRSNFQAKVPSVLLKSSCGTVHCEITIGSDLAYFTNKYLTLYSQRDSRLRKLAVLFRYWAKVCEVDNQDRGTLPSYCYAMMTVHFLQQHTTQILPVLWKDISEAVLKRPKTHQDIYDMFEELQKQPFQSQNNDSLGMLWIDLLQFYGMKFDMAEFVVCVRSQKLLHRHEKKWKSRRVAIEDPFSPKRNVARSMHSTRVFDYFYNCLRKACLYFSVPTSQNSSLSSHGKHTHNKTGNQGTEKTVTNSEKAKEVIDKKTDNDGCTPCTSDNLEILNVVNGDSKTAEGCSANADNCHDPATASLPDGLESEGSGLTGTESDASIKPHILMEHTDSSVPAISDLEASTEIDKPAAGIITQEQTGGADNNVTDLTGNITSVISVSNTTDIAGIAGAECDKCETNESNSVMEVIEQGDGPHDDESTNKSVTTHDSSMADIGVNCEESAITQRVDTSMDESSVLTDIIGADFGYNTTAIMLDDSVTVSQNESIQADKDQHNVSDLMEHTQDNSVMESDKDSTHVSDVDTTQGNSVQEDQVTEDKVEDSETESGSDTESDQERESPDSSPTARRPPVLSDTDKQYNFVFSTHTLTDGKGPSIFCQICEREGHHKNNCPEDRLPHIKELAPLTKEHADFLTYVVDKVPNDFSLSKEEIKEREYIRRNVEMYLLDIFPDCELRLFGSSKNGFGFHQSDLDICVTFKDRSQKDVDFIQCIDAIAKHLKTHRGLYQVFPITTAKVPIVKFKHRNTQLEGDISMYNVLALQNTKLLQTYASIDKRAKILGFTVKVFAKVCDIGDASKGSLSSYAYMLLMFHYLQHTKPPVIPVLQELRASDTINTELMIDGWNAWFYDDLKTIPAIWPHYGKNKQSVGELWLGFFRYYMEEFNLDDQVVTIRQFETLTKFEKLWNGKCIAIEDPFDLNHNLGSGLSRKMNQYILRTFIHARELYGRPISAVPNGFDTLEDYFFDRDQLTEGKPPSDRLCRVCSKIGHIAKECPRLLAKKEREAAERKRKEEMKKAQENNTNSPTRHDRPPSASRSKSDPADYGSPNKRVTTQVYQRQHSESNQRQTNSGRDGYHYYQPSSPQGHQGQGQPFQGQGHQFHNRYPQSPRTSTPQSHHQQQQQYQYRVGHPSNLFSRTNQNMEYNGNRHPQPNRNDKKNVQNYHKNHPANQRRDHTASPSSPNQNSANIKRHGQSDVPRHQHVSVVDNSFVSSGVGLTSSGVGLTNPVYISPQPMIYSPYGMPYLPYYTIIHQSDTVPPVPGAGIVTAGPVVIPQAYSSENTRISAGNVPGRTASNGSFSVQGSISGNEPAAFGDNPVNYFVASANIPAGFVTANVSNPAFVAKLSTEPVCVSSGQTGTSPSNGQSETQRSDRKVNIHDRSGPLPDVGITMRNEHYKAVDKAKD